jgi:hypothetical protein
MTYSLKTQIAMDHLEEFSADVIASLSLAQYYDLQRIAHDIDFVLKEIGYLPNEENNFPKQ